MSEERHRAYAESLSKPERVLIVVRDELYGGDWDELSADLLARQNRKPYVFKLNSRIDEDLNRIAKLRGYEEAQGINLRAYLEAIADTEEGIPL